MLVNAGIAVQHGEQFLFGGIAADAMLRKRRAAEANRLPAELEESPRDRIRTSA
jgi:hypothetical protein